MLRHSLVQQLDRIDNALAHGQLVVLLERCHAGLDNARAASRRLSHWLAQLRPCPSGGLSRSATSGLAAAAAYRHGPIGVDVERRDNGVLQMDEALAFVHPLERTLRAGHFNANDAMSIWVRKEAVLKAFGTGLAVAPDSLYVGTGNRDWKAVVHPLLGTAQVVTLCAPPGFVGAAAAREACPPTLLVIEADSTALRAR